MARETDACNQAGPFGVAAYPKDTGWRTPSEIASRGALSPIALDGGYADADAARAAVPKFRAMHPDAIVVVVAVVDGGAV